MQLAPISPWFVAVLCVLATYRITRLIVRDAFPPIAYVRDWIQEHFDPFDDESWDNFKRYKDEERQLLIGALRQKGISTPTQWKRAIAYLVTCAWCVSVYVGFGVVGLSALFLHMNLWIAVLLWLTSSALTGLISQREPETT